MVDGGGLENHWTGNCPGGSNPSPSANFATLSCRRERSSGIARLSPRLARIPLPPPSSLRSSELGGLFRSKRL